MFRLLLSLIVCGVLAFAGAPGAKDVPLNSRVTVHEPIRIGNLTVFPVTNAGGPDTSKYLTLDEGLAKGLVKVGELGALSGVGASQAAERAPFGGPMVRPIEPPIDGRRIPTPRTPLPLPPDAARVNELAIQNLSDRPLLLLAGEVVSGGKQDRVVARERIVPPHSEPVPLGVFCVEPGRWQGASAAFAPAKAMAHPQLRKQVTEARDQQKVWNEVAQANRQVMALAAASPGVAAGSQARRGGEPIGAGVAGGIAPSSSYARTMEAKPVQDKLGEQTRGFAGRLPRGAVGVVVALGGRIVWADLFASPALFDRYRDKLLQSYVVESARNSGVGAATPAVSEARDFLRTVSGRETTEAEPGLYRLIRVEASGLVTYELDALPEAVTLHFSRMAQ